MPLSSSVGHIQYTQVGFLLAAAAAAAVLFQLIEGVPFRNLLDDLRNSNQNTMVAVLAVDAEVVFLDGLKQRHAPPLRSSSSS